MGLQEKSRDLRKRMRTALSGGGDKAIEKQKAIGKLTARERIIALLDPKSFHEYDLFVEHAAKDFDMNKKYLLYNRSKNAATYKTIEELKEMFGLSVDYCR